ncbi:MAG: LptA/OstA family protein [Desulfomonilaceae bacterium]|nr:LptA/OstA family protein [Desulfomonilaceae bacterium]
MRFCTLFLALLVLIDLSAVSAWSESDKGILSFMGDSSRPVEIAADKAEGRSLPRGYETVFSGKVKVTQADMILTCDRLIIIYEQKEGSTSRSATARGPSDNLRSAENIRTITALGHVKIVQRDTTATAGKGVYDHAERTVTLSESPRLRQGSNVLEANTIVIFLEENRIEFEGGGQRIKGTLSPGNQKR